MAAAKELGAAPRSIGARIMHRGQGARAYVALGRGKRRRWVRSQGETGIWAWKEKGHTRKQVGKLFQDAGQGLNGTGLEPEGLGPGAQHSKLIQLLIQPSPQSLPPPVGRHGGNQQIGIHLLWSLLRMLCLLRPAALPRRLLLRLCCRGAVGAVQLPHVGLNCVADGLQGENAAEGEQRACTAGSESSWCNQNWIRKLPRAPETPLRHPSKATRTACAPE